MEEKIKRPLDYSSIVNISPVHSPFSDCSLDSGGGGGGGRSKRQICECPIMIFPSTRSYGDLRASESLLATDILVTSAYPDIVIIQDKDIFLIELTIPFNSPDSIKNTHSRKSEKPNYVSLLGDLEAKGLAMCNLACN